MARYAKSIALSLLNKKRSAVAPLNARLNIYGEIIPQIFLKKLKILKLQAKIPSFYHKFVLVCDSLVRIFWLGV